MKYLFLLSALLLSCAPKPRPILDQDPPRLRPGQSFEVDRDDMLAEFDAEAPFGPVYFDYDSFSLKETTEIARLAAHLMASGQSIQIIGHASEEGTEEYNLALGMRRAVAVQAYLVSYGIPWTRGECFSYGEEVPATDDPAEAWKNRRVEIEFLKKGEPL